MNQTTTLGSMKLEVTEWLPGSTRPSHEGVYERRVSDGAYSCWSGDAWNEDADSPGEAAVRHAPSRDQKASWRGLVEPSGLPCATCGGHTVVDGGQHPESGDDLLSECPDC